MRSLRSTLLPHHHSFQLQAHQGVCECVCDMSVYACECVHVWRGRYGGVCVVSTGAHACGSQGITLSNSPQLWLLKQIVCHCLIRRSCSICLWRVLHLYLLLYLKRTRITEISYQTRPSVVSGIQTQILPVVQQALFPTEPSPQPLDQGTSDSKGSPVNNKSGQASIGQSYGRRTRVAYLGLGFEPAPDTSLFFSSLVCETSFILHWDQEDTVLMSN